MILGKLFHSRRQVQVTLNLIALFIVLGIGIFWRFYNIDYRSLWYDEVEVIKVADSGGFLKVLLGARSHLSAPPLDYLFRALWQQIGGINDAWVRSYSGLWGTVAILLTYFVGKKLYNSKVGLLAALFLAVSTFHVHYSAEVKFYALLVTMFLALLLSWLSLIHNPKMINWLYLTTIGILGVYTHPYIVLAIAVCMATLFIRSVEIWRHKKKVVFPVSPYSLQIIGVSLAIALAYLPWVLWDFWGQPKGWAAPELTWYFLSTTLIDFIPGGSSLVIFFMLGLFISLMNFIGRRCYKATPLWFSIILSIPVVYILDLFGNYPILSKQLIFVQPILFILVSHGLIILIQKITSLLPLNNMSLRPIITGAFTATFGVLMVFYTSPSLFNEKNPDNWLSDNWRNVIEIINENASAVDSVYWATHNNMFYDVIEWHLNRSNPESQYFPLFKWWEKRVLSIDDIYELSHRQQEGKIWLFGPVIDDLFNNIGLHHELIFTTVGNVNIYQIDNPATWDFSSITAEIPFTLVADDIKEWEVFLLDRYIYQLVVEIDGYQFHGKLPTVIFDGNIIPFSEINPNQGIFAALFEFDKPGIYSFSLSNRDTSATLRVNKYKFNRYIKIDSDLNRATRVDARDMILTGAAQSIIDDLLRNITWEYLTGDSGTLSIWIEEGGLYQITIRGAAWGPPPAILNVLLNGAIITSLNYYSEWESIPVFITFPTNGFHSISLSFANDYSGPDGDRNLIIEWVEVSKYPGILFQPSVNNINPFNNIQRSYPQDDPFILKMFSENPRMLLAEFQIKSDHKMERSNIIVKLNDTILPIEYLDDQRLRIVISVEEAGNSTLTVSANGSIIEFRTLTLSPVAAKAQPYLAKALDLNYPPENQILIFNQQGLVRYTNGEVASSRIWFEEAGRYQLIVSALNSIPGPVILELFVDDQSVGFLNYSKEDWSLDEISLIINIPKKGFHNIGIFFTNDYFGPEGDRNAIISHLELRGID
jgi:uncharacterized membrane protein